MSKLIKDWVELSKIPNESETHVLEVDIDGGNGWLSCKNGKNKKAKDLGVPIISEDEFLNML